MRGIDLGVGDHSITEAALRRSEGRLGAAADLFGLRLGLGLYDWDPQSNQVNWDAGMRAIWGLPPEAPVDYAVWRAHVHPDDLARVLAAMDACIDPARAGILDIEYRVIGLDGVERWVATRGETSFRDGKPVAFHGVALDTTDRKRANERLRQNEARLSAILAQIPVGVALLDCDGHFLLRGGPGSDLWDAVASLHDPSTRHKWRNPDGSLAFGYHVTRVLRGETVVPGVDVIHTAEDGREIWFRLAAAPFRNSEGGIVGAILILENVDDEKRVVQAVRESEERFRQFADYSSGVIWMLGLCNGRLEYLGRAYEAILGAAREWSQGYWTDAIHPDDRQRAASGLERAARGEVVVQEYRIIRADGALRSVRDTLFPMRDEHGDVQRVGGISEDVTIRTGSLVYLIASEEAERPELERLLVQAGYRVKIFASGADFLAVAPVLALGCVVLNSRSPAAGGLIVARQLKADGSRLPVLVLGARDGDVATAVQGMKAGAADWVEMPSEPGVLLAAIASALTGIRAADEHSREIELVRARVAGMARRERQVLEGLLAGGTNKTIGRELGISPRTVELHRSRVMKKLGVQNLTRAMLLVGAAGIRPMPWRDKNSAR
jgi:PAS domain S-box-containing protein